MEYIKQNFSSWTPRVERYTTNKDRLAIVYSGYDPDIEEVDDIIVATVNIPSTPLREDEVLVKNWSENEGIYEMMVAAGHISPSIGVVPTGYTNAYICKCLLPIPELQK